MLFQPSMSGVGRVELYNVRDGPISLSAKSPQSRRPEKRVRLCDCLSITLAQEHAGSLRDDPPWRTPRFEDIQWNVQDRTVTLTGPLDAPRIRELTAWATRGDNLPEALSVQPRSLEDVFLEVSGRDAQ